MPELKPRVLLAKRAETACGSVKSHLTRVAFPLPGGVSIPALLEAEIQGAQAS